MKNKKVRLILVILIFMAGFFLRLGDLDRESFNIEEAINYTIVTQPDVISVYERVIEQKNAQPLFYVLGYCWVKIVPLSETGLRLLSVILGSLVLLALYFLSRNFLSVGLSLAVMCLACFSNYLIDVSRGFTHHSALLLFICVNMGVFFRMNKKPVGRFFVWVFILSGALALNTHSVTWYYLITQFALTSFFHIDKTCLSFRRYLSYLTVILLFSIQNIIISFNRFFEIVYTYSIFPQIKTYTVMDTLVRVFFGTEDLVINIFWILGIFVFIGCFFRGFLDFNPPKGFLKIRVKNRYLLYCICFVAGQIGLPLIGSYFVPDFFSGGSYVLSAVGSVYIILCFGIFSLKKIKYFVFIGVIFLNICSFGYSKSNIHTPNYRSVAKWVSRYINQGDIIVCFDKGSAEILNCYGLRKNRKLYLPPEVTVNQLYSLMKKSGNNIWAVSVSEDNQVDSLFIKKYKLLRDFKQTGDAFICVYNYKIIDE